VSQAENRRRFLERLTAEARRDGATATFEEVPMNIILTERNVSAGTDPETGLPALCLDGLSALGFEAPDQRYLLSREVAVEVGEQLLLAGDPTLAELVRAAARRSTEPR
jgi:hypothetical protein